ncbi:universal stress protein [Streptomyces lavendulocolor]|uniref:universal stress protein n=1 Tax=Streptomyces lavendulocolor TaxID=67316 RepID=UPI0031DB2CB1
MSSDTLSVRQPGTVVAGVDGSVSARAAALWAADEARRSGRTLRLVHGASLDHLLRFAPAGAEDRLREAGRVCHAHCPVEIFPRDDEPGREES